MRAEIRGLTLWRPWQNAFLLEERTYPGQHLRPKRVENRDWYPKWAVGPMHQGVACAMHDHPLWIALHAGKQADKEALAEVRRWGWPELELGTPGLIVAVCRLVKVLDFDALGERHPLIAQHDAWAVGRYCWEFDKLTKLASPVQCKGAQGLWNITGGVVEQVRQQWELARGRR